MSDPILTHHAKQRAKERVGLKKTAVKRQAKRALKKGFHVSDTTGSFRRYLDKLYFKYETAGQIRVYGEHIYLFNGEAVLITIMHLPNEYKRAARKIREAM